MVTILRFDYLSSSDRKRKSCCSEFGRQVILSVESDISTSRSRSVHGIFLGELGKILYISTTRVNLGLFQPDINVVWDLAPHDISIILYIIGDFPVSVNSQGKAHFKPEIEDVAATTLNFRNGMIAFIHSSWLDPNKIRRTTIVGTRKMLVYDDIDPNEKIKIYDKGVEVPPYYDTFADFQFSYRYGDIHSPRIEDYEPLKKVCDHFIECIRTSRTPLSDGYSGLKVVSILEAANKSLKLNGKAVSIPGLKILHKKWKNNGNGFVMASSWR